MASANFAKNHFAVFYQTYIAGWYSTLKMMRWHIQLHIQLLLLLRPRPRHKNTPEGREGHYKAGPKGRNLEVGAEVSVYL